MYFLFFFHPYNESECGLVLFWTPFEHSSRFPLLCCTDESQAIQQILNDMMVCKWWQHCFKCWFFFPLGCDTVFQSNILSFFVYSILNSGKIKDVIDHTKLDPLLPEDMIAPLEQQFLITKEVWCFMISTLTHLCFISL